MTDYKLEILNHEYIYVLMYAQRNEKSYPNVEDVIISVKVENNIDFTTDRKGFVYVWGRFAGDYDYHDFNNYGKTWAYTKQELIDYWTKGADV